MSRRHTSGIGSGEFTSAFFIHVGIMMGSEAKEVQMPLTKEEFDYALAEIESGTQEANEQLVTNIAERFTHVELAHLVALLAPEEAREELG